MELGTSIAGAIMIALCVLPFVLSNRNRKRHEIQLLKMLTNIINNQNCKLSRYECFGDIIIGIDEIALKVFFLSFINAIEKNQYINLSEIKHSKVVCISKTHNNEKSIDKLELCFCAKIKTTPDIKFEFYNSDNCSHNSPDYLIVDKWSKIINENINKKN